MSSSKDRRFPRLGAVVLKSRVRWAGDDFDAYVTSLSEGGAFLVTDREMGIGRALELELRLPFGLGALSLEAETLYVSGRDAKLSGFGIKFLNLTPPMLETLRGYVDGFRALAASLEAKGGDEASIDLAAFGLSPGK